MLAVRILILIVTLLSTLYFGACGGATLSSTGDSGSDGVTGTTNDSSGSDEDSDSDSSFTENQELQSFLIMQNVVETFDTFDLNFLVKGNAFNLSFIVPDFNLSLCPQGGNIDASDDLFDYSDCTTTSNGYELTQNGTLEVDREGSSSNYQMLYEYTMVVSGPDTAFNYAVTGTVDASVGSSSNAFDVILDCTIDEDVFKLRGELTQDEDGLITGSLILIFNTIIKTCTFDATDVTDQTTFDTTCSF